MRHLLLFLLFFPLILGGIGCNSSGSSSPSYSTTPTNDLVQVWGNRGERPGQFIKPRALVYDAKKKWLYVVDMTARIQAFDLQGRCVLSFQTPISELGKPTGLGIAQDGSLLVADTHYHRVLCYSSQGTLQWQFGEYGTRSDQFVYVTDVVMDKQGYIYVAQYGDSLGKYDRIQKFTAQGKFILAWGERGTEPGQLERPMALAIDMDGNILVADACNHRIQRFSSTGKLLQCWGTPGSDLGELSYPYGISVDIQGNIYVSEFGNNRIQKFSSEGKSLGIFGVPGQFRGMFVNPWDIDVDEYGIIYVADSLNHRIQRISGIIFE